MSICETFIGLKGIISFQYTIKNIESLSILLNSLFKILKPFQYFSIVCWNSIERLNTLLKQYWKIQHPLLKLSTPLLKLSTLHQTDDYYSPTKWLGFLSVRVGSNDSNSYVRLWITTFRDINLWGHVCGRKLYIKSRVLVLSIKT